jgi:transcriptional regulator with XRE-family HTH domain
MVVLSEDCSSRKAQETIAVEGSLPSNPVAVHYPPPDLSSRGVVPALVLSCSRYHSSKGFRTVGEFGKKFRKARESKQLSLDSVSNVTKISARMLQAIEEEKFDLLPGGVFNKGFIRAYAKHLGLDPEDAITEYLDCLRQEQVDSHDGWDSNSRSDARAAAKSAVAAPAKPAANAPPVAGREELPHLHLPRAEHIRPARKEYLGRPSPGIPWTLIYLVAIIVIAIAIL